MKELIGKTIAALRVNDDQSILTFDHSDGTSTSYKCYGDCCSETWFADITGVTWLIGATVTDSTSIDLEAVYDGRTRQEYDEFYGTKLRTNKGFVDIVYRNSSNGYYGGGIHLYLNALPENMTSITDDWRA